tara:strand:- start:256 stop:693 length:438 start_codon:yes stop_codon:yes gene_type:complete
MNYYKLMVAALFFYMATKVSATEDPTYLCVSEESTGFYYENKSWGRAHFNVSDEKYIIRKIKENEFGFEEKETPYGVFTLGGQNPVYMCFIDEYSNDFRCKVGVGEFYFSPESGRFIKTYTAGYWDGVNNNDNTPHIARGRCSKI